MTRTSTQLSAEIKALGITLDSQRKYSREDMQVILRDFLWKRDHRSEIMPEQYQVMLAGSLKDIVEQDEERGTSKAEEIWASSRWVAQEKLDGCRIVCSIEKSGPRFMSRNISVETYLYDEKTENLPYHTALRFPESLEGTVLDGEMLAPYSVIDTRQFVTGSKGTITATALQAVGAVINSGPNLGRKIQEKYGPVEYHVFDILKFKGKDVRNEPYERRQEYLREAFSAMDSAIKSLFILVPTHVVSKKELYERLVAAGKEGIMLKDLKASYEGKRSKYLLKVKRFEDVDAFVTGFIAGAPTSDWKDLVGALVFSVINKTTGKPHIVGCVSAMTLEFRKSITIPSEPLAEPMPTQEFVYDLEGKPLPSRVGTRVINYKLDPKILGKVAVIRGQQFEKSVRLKHCACPEAYTSEGAWLPWRTDKAALDCILDVEAIRKRVLSGERV